MKYRRIRSKLLSVFCLFFVFSIYLQKEGETPNASIGAIDVNPGSWSFEQPTGCAVEQIVNSSMPYSPIKYKTYFILGKGIQIF